MTEKLLLENLNKYPQMQIEDVFKYLHQSCFGCGHFISDPEKVTAYIEEEYNEAKSREDQLITPLDGNYSRVDLGYISKGLDPKTLGKLFYLSSKEETLGKAHLEGKLNVVKNMILSGKLPFDRTEFSSKREEWKKQDYPATHHSEIYRESYEPAYRAISNRYVPFLPLFAEIDKKLKQERVFLAIEGGSAGGKSTLGKILTDIYGCTLFHMDDYFLRPEQRTKERLNEAGGNVDRERFLEEILLPASKGENICYRPYNCAKGMLDDEVCCELTDLSVTEGAYSMHPQLSSYYNLSVFIDIDPELQRERVTKRNPKIAHRFFDEWIPMEQKYFKSLDIKDSCDLLIKIQ